MKNLLIILFLVNISVGLQAQINIPKDTIDYLESTITIDLSVFNFNKLNYVVNDSMEYITSDYYPFVDVSTVDEIFNNSAYKNDTVINGKLYRPQRKPIFKIYRSGKLILAQQVQIWSKKTIDKSDGVKMFYYLKKAKELGATSDQLWNYPPVDSIVHPEKYITIKDSIQ